MFTLVRCSILLFFAQLSATAFAMDEITQQRSCAMALVAQFREQYNSGKPTDFRTVVVENNRAFVNTMVGWFVHNHVRFYVVSGMLFAEDTQTSVEHNTQGRAAYRVTELGNYRLTWNSEGEDAFVYYPATGVLIKRAPGFRDLGFGQNVPGLFFWGVYVRSDAFIYSEKRFLRSATTDVAIPQGVITSVMFRRGVPHIVYRPWQ